MNNFEELEAWRQARIIRNEIAILVKSFPPEEKYKLTDQMLRSSRSVTANISEGYGRFHYQENIQFCRFLRGSLNETLDHLICAFDCSYIDEKTLGEYRLKIMQNIKVLNGYIAYLKRRKHES